MKGLALPQRIGLDPWEFVKPGHHWTDRGKERVLLEGVYPTAAGKITALDWEQPSPKDLEMPEGTEGMPGMVCCDGLAFKKQRETPKEVKGAGG